MELPKARAGRIRLAAAIAAVVLLYVAYRRFFPDFDLNQILQDVSSALGDWTYLLVTVFAFLETGAFVGLVVPGETIVVLGGAVAGQGETDVLLTIGLVWAAAFLGDSASFLLGARLGRGFVLRHGERLRITRERFAQVESYFANHGGKTILIGRFIGLIRALAPFIAGSSGMRYAAMAPYSILGTGLWAVFFTLLGYFASQNLQAVVDASEKGLFYFGVTVAVIVGIVAAVRYLRVPENRARLGAEMRRRPWLRPLLRLGPEVRFLWERLTPGGLGIELTAPLAALAVGSFVLISYATILGDAPGPTPGDQTAADIAASLRVDWLTSIEKVITALGSSTALLIVGGAAAIVLAVRRDWVELATLLIAIPAMLVAVNELKDAVMRPRPSGALVAADGDAYPSGHAAYSVIYSWLAIIITVRLRPHWSGATALLVAGLLLTAAIGLSRVYLGVHYLSDVIGGWALGTSAFAVGTVIAVVVAFFRQNRPGES
jgi:membrane protein DedA with SNARE-associated domain/membrane-associated phospholipid phosphatase